MADNEFVEKESSDKLRAAEAAMNPELGAQDDGIEPTEPSAPQGLAENQKEMLVANHKVIVETDENGLPVRVSTPEGLEGDELENWQKKADNEIKALAISQAKYERAKDIKTDVLEQAERLRQREEFLRQREAEFKRKQDEAAMNAKKARDQERIQTTAAEHSRKFTERVMELLGVKTKEEFDDLRAEDMLKVTGVIEQVRKEYDLADRDAFQSRISENLKKQVTLTELTKQVESDGYDIKDVVKFATQKSMPVNSETYDYFKFQANQNTLSFQVNRIQRVKNNTVTFVKRGDMSPDTKVKPLTAMQAEAARLRKMQEAESG